MTDSSTGGYLAPNVDPINAASLDDIFQGMIVGITGLPGANVRPLWQPLPPGQLPAGTDWAAVGVMEEAPDSYAFIRHIGDGLGSDEMQHHSTVSAMASFYGPNAQTYATRLWHGLLVGQNREALDAQGIKLTGTSALRHVPEPVNTQWIRRVDMEISFRRIMTIVYPVLNIVAAVEQASSEKATVNQQIPPGV